MGAVVRANCPNMRVKMYKKHASTLMANNIASTARLQLVIGDDPDVLTKKFGFDKYDAEDMGKVLKEGSRSGSIEGGDSKGSHHHGHHHHSIHHHRPSHSHRNSRFSGIESCGKEDEPCKSTASSG